MENIIIEQIVLGTSLFVLFLIFLIFAFKKKKNDEDPPDTIALSTFFNYNNRKYKNFKNRNINIILIFMLYILVYFVISLGVQDTLDSWKIIIYYLSFTLLLIGISSYRLYFDKKCTEPENYNQYKCLYQSFKPVFDYVCFFKNFQSILINLNQLTCIVGLGILFKFIKNKKISEKIITYIFIISTCIVFFSLYITISYNTYNGLRKNITEYNSMKTNLLKNNTFTECLEKDGNLPVTFDGVYKKYF